MNNDSLVQVLVLVAIAIFFGIIALIFVLFLMRSREKQAKEAVKKEEEEKQQVKKTQITYTFESIFDFMDFDKIEDNMIIQKKGKFLMVVECKGINYDLMSEMEKVSVEQGFIEFLNTLRNPIQLYIQTRTVNLEKSIDGYRSRLKDIERKYNSLTVEYEKRLKSGSKEDIEKTKYEMVKQKNLKDYTEDIIKDIERQSLNRNILSKKYYVVIPCYQSEIESGDFDKSEVRNMAFSELYTRARSIINALYACQVTGKILNSEELVELLYIAYNRDEADLFWMDKMKTAGFEDLYSTAPDVLDKKIKLLDEQIEEKSVELANEKISEARREREIEIAEKERNEDKIVNKKAKELIKRHKKYIGEEIATSAIEKLDGNVDIKSEDKDKTYDIEKEETENGTIQEKGRRGRPRRKV